MRPLVYQRPIWNPKKCILGEGKVKRGCKPWQTDYLVLKFCKFGVPHTSWHTDLFTYSAWQIKRQHKWGGRLALLNISAGHFWEEEKRRVTSPLIASVATLPDYPRVSWIQPNLPLTCTSHQISRTKLKAHNTHFFLTYFGRFLYYGGKCLWYLMNL